MTILYLSLIWLGGVILDRAWFFFDQSVPAWDQADYLNGVMNYWSAFQTPEWFNPNWWEQIWLLSSKIPPGMYILTAPFLEVFGTNYDAATIILTVFSAILIVSVYGLGCLLFNPKVGLLAAILCQILPGLYRYRTEFVLDYPVTAIVTLCFFFLTLWKQSNRLTWLSAIGVGITIGFGLMIKQTVLLFLLFPIIWLLLTTLWEKKWQRLLEICLGFMVSLLIFYPWYRTNWLLILTSGKRATVDSAIAEGDPALNTIDAWIYYGKILPYLLSWHLLIIPIVCFLIYGFLWLRNQNWFNDRDIKIIRWLAIFLIGGYFLNSSNINKDARYILPLLPILSLIFAQGLYLVRRQWRGYLISGSVGLGILLMILNLFPLKGEMITKILSPNVQHYPTIGKDYPHQEVISEIVKTSPYLRTTLGVLPSTPIINQHNFSFYGAKANFQVYGRQVGVEEGNIEKDARSLPYFLTKSGDQGSVSQPQTLITRRIETGDDFRLTKTWELPDRTSLKLYQKKEATVEVNPIADTPRKVKLTNIEFPEKIPADASIPIRYTWEGNWQELKSGIVLLTWEGEEDFWLHDHGIGMGNLSTQLAKKGGFQVRENTAMFVPPDLPSGDYILKGRYIDRETRKSYPLDLPDVSLKVEANVSSPNAPELDLVTQLRLAAMKLPQGEAALEDIFATIERINQYDPIQDYLKQAEIALKYRLQAEEIKLEWLYPLALSEVLQRDAEGAIEQFKTLTELDSKNPHSYAYLAFVYLYDWQPQAAEKTLETALNLNPNLDILHTLDGVSALMQGNIIKALSKLNQ